MSSLALRRACRSLSTQHVRGFTGAPASNGPVAGARGLAGSSKITRIQESFFEPVNRVVVNVPATTANLGPGFDSFGFALDVWNRVTVERADKFSLTVLGEGSDTIDTSEKNIVVKMCRLALKTLGQEMPPLQFECQNAVPPTRGMGSSSAALVSGLAAGLALGGKDLSTPATKKLLLQLAADEEGHPDNVAPAIYGGFQIALQTPTGQWITQRVNIPEGTQCVLFIPDEEMSTTEARKALPESLSYADAIHNISRASMLVNCFATGQFDPLRYAMQDKLHQQYRSHMFPFEPIIKVALEAGAHGAYLSGAGPTVLAITGGSGRANVGDDTMSHFLAEATADAMIREASDRGISGTAHIATPSEVGIKSTGVSVSGVRLWTESFDRSSFGNPKKPIGSKVNQ
jgi:homoserine kinase